VRGHVGYSVSLTLLFPNVSYSVGTHMRYLTPYLVDTDYFGDRCATTESGAPHARTALVEGRYQALTVGVTVVPSASADLQQPSSPSILQCLALQCVSRRRTSIGSSVKMGIRRSERDASEIPYLRP